jgi:hypothetical protein
LGLTRALIFEVLRRMRDLGATVAWVNSTDDEAPANALYASTGFEVAVRWVWWERL